MHHPKEREREKDRVKIKMVAAQKLKFPNAGSRFSFKTHLTPEAIYFTRVIPPSCSVYA